MTDEEKFNKWLEEHDGEDYCEYCTYDADCNGMAHGPNGPIEPPCCSVDDIKELLDMDWKIWRNEHV